MFSRIWLAMFLALPAVAAFGAPASVIETKQLDSAILRENRIGLNPLRRIKVYLPPVRLCTDNAAMIAVAGHEAFRRGERADLTLGADASWRL